MQRSPRWALFNTLLILTAILPGCAATQGLVRNLNPNRQRDYDVKITIAQVYEKEGKLREAVEMYRELHASHPDEVLLSHRFGVVMMELGSDEEGLLLLEEAHLLAPDDAAILNDLGYGYILAGDLETAEDLIRRSYELAPEDERTIANLALVAGYAGRDRECLALFKQVVSNAEAHANLGYICSQRGQGSQAIEHYSRALDYDPELRAAAVGLTQLYDMRQDFDREQHAIAAREQAAQPAVQRAASAETSADEVVGGRVELIGGDFNWAR